jgi:DNA polymerase
MKTVFIDFETFYSNEFSLRKMTPVEYILDQRFEIIGCAIKIGNEKSFWLDGDQLPKFFAELDPAETAMVSHNALFDQCIVAWKFNFIPRLMLDTLGVSRALLGHELKSMALAKVAEHLGIGIKGGTVHKVAGMGRDAIIAAGLYDEYVEYSLNDVDLCAAIYKELVASKKFPFNEMVVMDMVLRCAVQPQLHIDSNVLAQHLATVQAHKENLLAAVNVDKSELMSNEKFAEALRFLGVEPPTKISMVTGKEAYAFSKTDPEFIALEEHENPAVQALVAARLGFKSTLEETRTQRFLSIANLQWSDRTSAVMPMPLRYSGAHTHRLSGDWNLNVQNMPRGGELRRALIAPPGHVVLAADASQIEARIVAWLCNEQDLLDQFEKGEDVYSKFASKVFKREIDKKKDPTERFIGKTAILGLGYGLGWQKFQKTIKLQSKAQTGKVVDLSDEEAKAVVDTYRESYSCIKSVWGSLNSRINILAADENDEIEAFELKGVATFIPGKIRLPSGLHLHYHDLKETDGDWSYTYGGKTKRLYGGALLENITQALARIVVMDAATRLRPQLAIHSVQLALQVHDELVYVVPDDIADVCKNLVLKEMCARPAWAKSLPLAAEADIGRSYGDAK